MRGGVIAIMLCATLSVSAQIRIIPQDVVQRAATIEVADHSLQFHPESVDFGSIDEMSGIWKGEVKLHNLGADTLAITQIKSTCGCLKAEVTERVVTPKGVVSLALKYYPRGHAGAVKQRVLVYTNRSSETPSAALTLIGRVTASEDRADDYPFSRGALRLRQERVQLTEGGKQVERIACMNGGSTPLHLSTDSQLLPRGLKVTFEPSTLAPKQEGDIVVEFDPEQGSTAIGSKIYIKGLNLPPRQSTVEIVKKN